MLLVKIWNRKEMMRMNKILMWKRGHHVLHGQKMTTCDWLKELYVSGQNAEMLKEKAFQMYKDETKQHFTLYYWWTEVRQQPKWSRIYAEKENKQTRLRDPSEDTLESMEVRILIY
ncbi:hypothetical protein GUJ93_ZPchr0011g28826 [Zizania palustris]|uniref:Uncharacterized protein n=1 Tax=Zizania palustris TaxID=103762 RepID=A0A8J5WLP4_ZIZPA|nr:hypothetical protein GUJ93_ZPchr0011g28826 [Zizania palustris]